MDTSRRTVPAAGTVVLVEGESDRVAVTTLARRRGHDLAAAGVAVLPMGGATNVWRYVGALTSPRSDVRLAGLCDLAELRHFCRALARAGLVTEPTREALEHAGFFACARDLEDELIRSLGAVAVQDVLEQQGELGSFRVFQRQPAQREKAVEQQLRRFLGTHSGRKAQYAEALVEALPDDAAPPPLARLLGCL